MTERFLRANEWLLEVVSPVHVGSGDRMTPLDYAVMTSNNRHLLVVYDFASLGITDPAAIETFVHYLHQGPGWELVEQRARQLGSVEPKRAIRYVLPMRTGGKVEDVLPFVRDIQDRAYVPGSTVKGAIRTALLHGWCLDHADEMKKAVTGVLNKEQKPRSEFVAQELEKQAFGRDPNHDVLRALRVADSEPVPCDGQYHPKEAVLRADRLPAPEHGTTTALRQWIEALMPGTKVRVRITLDTNLFEPRVQGELRFDRWRSVIENWPRACRRFSSDLLDAQAEMFERFGDKGSEWCRKQKDQMKASQQSFLLPIGWGVGWEGKTVGMLMTDDEYAEVKAAYSLAKDKTAPTQYIDGIFPATRWALRTSGGSVPLGWVRLTPLT